MANYRTVSLTVSSAIFMQFLDATALNTALPAMARDLHVQPTDLNVAILSYQLSMAALIPAGAALADRIGARRAFGAALAMFMIGSILCALSRSLAALTAARAVQGLGGAVMMPVSRLLVVRSAEPGELVSAINWLMVPGIMGPLLGPAFGGLMVTYFSWPWIFMINVPVALAAMLLTLLLIPPVGGTPTSRFDIRGILLLAPAIVACVFGLESLSRPAALLRGVALLATGGALGLGYVRHAGRTARPAIDLTLLRIASFRDSAIAGTIFRTALGAVGFVWPLWLQLGLGLPPATAGLVLVTGPLGTVANRFTSNWLIAHIHPRHLAFYGSLPSILLTLVFLWLRPGVPLPLLCALMALHGFFVSIPLSVIGAVAYVEIPPERAGAASGLYVLLQQLTLSIGVTAGVWAIAGGRRLSHASLHDNRTYVIATLLLAGLAATSLFATARLDRDAAAALRPKPRAA